ncbi:Uncharacterised protein [Bordetella pertussis]|nr:Uncharacterised protein [Bordetella pertussis]
MMVAPRERSANTSRHLRLKFTSPTAAISSTTYTSQRSAIDMP